MRLRNVIALIIGLIYFISDFSTILFTYVLPSDWLSISLTKLLSSFLVIIIVELIYVFYDAFRGKINRDSHIIKFLQLNRKFIKNKSNKIDKRDRVMFLIMFLSFLFSPFGFFNYFASNSTYSELKFYLWLIAGPIGWYIIFKIFFIFIDYINN